MNYGCLFYSLWISGAGNAPVIALNLIVNNAYLKRIILTFMCSISSLLLDISLGPLKVCVHFDKVDYFILFIYFFSSSGTNTI